MAAFTTPLVLAKAGAAVGIAGSPVCSHEKPARRIAQAKRDFVAGDAKVQHSFSASKFAGRVVAKGQRADKAATRRAFIVEAAGKQITVGVIGAGRIGRVHAETISYRVPDAKIGLIADPYPEGLKKLGEDLGVATTADYKDIINNKDIDAVLICSPSDQHATQIKEAAAAGKHVFCEKPISLDLRVIDECLAAVDKAGVKFFTAFQRRYDPNFKALHDAVKDGSVGEVFHVHCTSRDPGPPPIAYVKQSGGIFLDMAIHDFDMLRYLTLSDPVEVYTRPAVRVDPEVPRAPAPAFSFGRGAGGYLDLGAPGAPPPLPPPSLSIEGRIGAAGDYDSAITVVTFKSGAVGVIDNCRKATYGYDQRAEVFGSKTRVTISNETASRLETWGPDGIVGQKPLDFFMTRYTKPALGASGIDRKTAASPHLPSPAYENEILAFIDCVVNDKPSPTPGTEGRWATLSALAALKSAKEGRPVKLSEVDI
eukprot:tig00020553_g10548.t1